jgi:hypothetical protein
LRPSSTYYIGFRAKNDATFSVGSSGDGPTLGPIQNISFYGGSVTNVLAGHSQIHYRIKIPADATRWKHTGENSTNLHFFLEEGTLTSKSHGLPWSNIAADGFGSQNQGLNFELNYWPWLPNHTFYLTVSNVSAGAENYIFRMDGQNPQTDDNDNDGLLDQWENQYFSTTGYSGLDDPDFDGVGNQVEFQDGTIPTNINSAKYFLNLTANGGTITVNPFLPKYNRGTNVLLTANPNFNQQFVNWSGSISTNISPVTVLMDSDKTIQANFETIAIISIFAPSIPSPGVFQFSIGGLTPGNIYILQASLDLSFWQSVSTNTATSASMVLQDNNVALFGQRYFRVITPE